MRRARRHADALTALAPQEQGVAIKDLSELAGVRCAHGSPLFADQVPDVSDILVERLETSGAIVDAASNTPEFGAVANTFNEVSGAISNRWGTVGSRIVGRFGAGDRHGMRPSAGRVARCRATKIGSEAALNRRAQRRLKKLTPRR